MDGIHLTGSECQGLFLVISDLYAGQPDLVFADDGTDDPDNPAISALAKLFLSVGQSVPGNLHSHTVEDHS
jgi:hypothetical protein